MASEPTESPANNPGLHATPDEATKGYFMQQTVSRFDFRFLSANYNVSFNIDYRKNISFFRCFESRTQKRVLTSILVCWACRKFMSLYLFSSSNVCGN